LSSSKQQKPEGATKWNPQHLAAGVLSGDMSALAQSITLIESTAPSHRAPAREVLERLAGHGRKNVRRIAISGVPGAGKSSFIEVLGNQLCDSNLRVAVLAVDPSSSRSGGSILGDKTRMETLSLRTECFIRPSPTGGALGGVTRRARETVMICEAAGFDVILIETVGVGQSEIAVRSLVDCFVLLLITGAGDDLQGIKKGIVEIADIVLVNKADGDNKVAAETTRLEFEGVMHILSASTEGWSPPVLAVSAHEGRGIAETWQAVEAYFEHLETTSQLESRRRQNNLNWYRSHVAEELYTRFQQDPGIAADIAQIEQTVLDGSLEPSLAVDALLKKLSPAR
jgi:LAO/AO transport system kinase